jgi:outer membrane receptor protein involved in Fe transport
MSSFIIESRGAAHKLSIVALVVTASLSANLTYAQEEATAVQAAAESSNETTEVIMVTSSRRAVTLQDEGASVVAINPDDFDVKGMNDISGVIDYSPGVTMSSTGGKGQGAIAARGVQQTLYVPVFAIYVDDTPVTSNVAYSGGADFLFDGMLMDVERVEIIKGPQGTLYGATAVGGMMRYISREPSMDEFRGAFGVDVSQNKEGGVSKTINGRVSFPLIDDKLGITISAYKEDDAGYLDQFDYETGNQIAEDVNDSDTFGYAFDLLYDVTDELSIALKHVKQKTEYGLEGSYVAIESGTSDKGVYSDYGVTFVPNDNSIDYQISSATINYETDFGTFTSSSSWVENKTNITTDYTPFYGYLVDYYAGVLYGLDVTYGDTDVPIYQNTSSEKFVQELRFTSERKGNFEWLGGFYYTHETSEFFQDVMGEFPEDSGLDDWVLADVEVPNEYTESSVFADGTYYFTEDLDVTLGFRLSDHESVLDFSSTGLLVGTGETYVDQTVEDTVATYLFSGRYRPTKDLSIYTRIASGYRPASSNIPIADESGTIVSPDIIEADTLWSYEVGAKGRFNDLGISYDLSIFHIDWDNFQAQVTENGASYGTNAEGGITIDGFDLQTVFNVTKSFSLTMSNSLSYSRLNQDEVGIGGLEGEQIPLTPKWTHSLQAAYEFEAIDGWYGSLGAGLRYSGSYTSTWPMEAASTSTENSDLINIDSRTIADLNLSLTDDEYTVGMYITNLFNNRAMKSADTGYNYLTGDTYYYGLFETPRTIGVRFSTEF